MATSDDALQWTACFRYLKTPFDLWQVDSWHRFNHPLGGYLVDFFLGLSGHIKLCAGIPPNVMPCLFAALTAQRRSNPLPREDEALELSTEKCALQILHKQTRLHWSCCFKVHWQLGAPLDGGGPCDSYTNIVFTQVLWAINAVKSWTPYHILDENSGAEDCFDATNLTLLLKRWTSKALLKILRLGSSWRVLRQHRLKMCQTRLDQLELKKPWPAPILPEVDMG